MRIQIKKLTDMMLEAFNAGVSCCCDLKQQIIEDILNKNDIHGEFKVWTIEQLKNMPCGSVFSHMTKGKCWVSKRINGVKYMQFENSKPVEFNTNNEPWSQPMMLIYIGEE